MATIVLVRDLGGTTVCMRLYVHTTVCVGHGLTVGGARRSQKGKRLEKLVLTGSTEKGTSTANQKRKWFAAGARCPSDSDIRA